MIHLCKTEADFLFWCKQLVPKARADYRAFFRKELDVHAERKYYDEVLAIRRQAMALRYEVGEERADFLERCLIGDEPYGRTAVEAEMQREIFVAWQKICFPEGTLGEQTINNTAIGRKLREMRKKKGFGVNRAAELLGISKDSLHAYESGVCQVKLEAMRRFAILYEFKLDELMADNDIIEIKPKNNYGF